MNTTPPTLNPAPPPKAAVIGFTLELYSRKFPGYMDRLRAQLDRFCTAIQEHTGIACVSADLCFTSEQAETQIAAAGKKQADAILLIPLSYACSGVIAPILQQTSLPLVIWNTQEEETIAASYNFDDLLMNHVTQGTQDLTSVLLRDGKIFGMESGHYRDRAALSRLAEWLQAARACHHGRVRRVGLLGRPFAGMDDFQYDAGALEKILGFRVAPLAIPDFIAVKNAVAEQEIDRITACDRDQFDIAPEVTPPIHRLSARLEAALRRVVADNRLDAFTMNFLDLLDQPGIGTLPFTGINKLLADGLGYAGEGDVLRAAQMALLRTLAGAANFTEIYTIDYRRNRLLMTHMQECNPALARRDRKIRLVKKDFWAPGIQPYAGMWFTLEPGPVTLTALTAGPGNILQYVTYETEIADIEPLPGLDIPHWMVQLDEPAGAFLNRYGLAGGPHHLIALPGRHSARILKLAHLQGLAAHDLGLPQRNTNSYHGTG